MDVDYWHLNAVTVLNRCQLSYIKELHVPVKRATTFNKLDHKSTHNLIQIVGGERWKTVFGTRYRYYEYLAILFGLANVPATFKAIMKMIFRDLSDPGIIVYINNVLIYTMTVEQHD